MMRFVHRCHAIWLLGLASSLAPPVEASETAIASVAVVGTEFRVTRTDGTVLAQPDLVGVVLTMADGKGGHFSVRIASVERDGQDAAGDITLYDFDVRDAGGQWQPFCKPGLDGRARGFPLAGVWTTDGRHVASEDFEIACTSGVLAKCVRAGYKPWKTHNGVSMWDYHQACVRMFRADYCGDGVSTTRDGTLINFADKLGIQVYDQLPDMHFEAAWSPEGAVCVRKVRIPENTSLDALARTCPHRLAGRVGDICTEAAPRALMFNQSRSPP